MAADVSSLVRILNEQKLKGAEHQVPITRDLLGGCSGVGPQELDLDQHVPSGWEKRLDLMSGEVYLQRCNSSFSLSSSETKPKQHQQQQKAALELQDLNFPPTLATESLDLKLFPSTENQSVCTLDKVKSALERAQRERASGKKRSLNGVGSDVSSSVARSSLSSPSVGDAEGERSPVHPEPAAGPVFASCCPSCLLYVLIQKSNPKCPRCDSVVPFRSLKKPRIDLNA